MSKIRLLKKIGVIFFLSQVFFPYSLFAAGFQLNEISPGLQGAATAGAAAANNDVSSMFTNPATLSTLIENQVYVGGSLVAPNIRMTNANATHTVNIPGFPPSNITASIPGSRSQSNVSAWALVPDGFLGWRINDKFVVGIGFTSPFGLTTDYEDSVLRFAARKSTLLTLNINPALAIKVTDMLSFGVGLQAQYAQVTFSNYNGAYTGDPGLNALLAANHPTKLRGRSWDYGYNVGILFVPYVSTRLGVGYRSRIVQDISGHGQQFTSPGPTVPAPSQDFLFNAETSVNSSINMPAVLTLSAAQDLKAWTLKASAQLNFWHTFKHLSINMPNAFATNSTIQLHWKNAWLFALGADYGLTPKWTVRAGTAYDQTPTSTQYRDPRIPDASRLWLTGGFTYLINKYASLDGAYEHIFARRAIVNVTQASGNSATSTVPLEVNQVSAKYKSAVDIFALALRYNFL